MFLGCLIILDGISTYFTIDIITPVVEIYRELIESVALYIDSYAYT